MVNTMEKFAHVPTVCTRLFFPPPPQEPGNEAKCLAEEIKFKQDIHATNENQTCTIVSLTYKFHVVAL